MSELDLTFRAPFKLALMLVTIAPDQVKAQIAFELACHCATKLTESQREEVKRELEALPYEEYPQVIDRLSTEVEISSFLDSMPVGEA